MKKQHEPLGKGDRMWITTAREAFEHGYTANWTREIFTVFRPMSDKSRLSMLQQIMREFPLNGRFIELNLEKLLSLKLIAAKKFCELVDLREENKNILNGLVFHTVLTAAK